MPRTSSHGVWDGRAFPTGSTGRSSFARPNSGWADSISDEYEKALLARIGDAYASEHGSFYYRHAEDQKDQLLIKAKDSDGVPFTVIHDFLLRDERSPYGQGYDFIYGDALARLHARSDPRQDDHVRLWAGASNGQTLPDVRRHHRQRRREFDGDWITLAYLGPNRQGVSRIEWFGDGTVKWYISKDLTRTLADINDFTDLSANGKVSAVPGDESGIGFSVPLPEPELVRAYLWMRLVRIPPMLQLRDRPEHSATLPG
jgi:hypothetical protein